MLFVYKLYLINSRRSPSSSSSSLLFRFFFSSLSSRFGFSILFFFSIRIINSAASHVCVSAYYFILYFHFRSLFIAVLHHLLHFYYCLHSSDSSVVTHSFVCLVCSHFAARAHIRTSCSMYIADTVLRIRHGSRASECVWVVRARSHSSFTSAFYSFSIWEWCWIGMRGISRRAINSLHVVPPDTFISDSFIFFPSPLILSLVLLSSRYWFRFELTHGFDGMSESSIYITCVMSSHLVVMCVCTLYDRMCRLYGFV